jgi:hypothetical protein
MSFMYWVVGIVVFMNVGTIIAIAGAAAKGVWWLSKLDSRVEKNKRDVNFAHEKIRTIERSYQ